MTMTIAMTMTMPTMTEMEGLEVVNDGGMQARLIYNGEFNLN